MSRRILLVEPDAGTRALMQRALRAAEFSVEDFDSVHHARLLLDDQAFDLAIVDELGASEIMLDEVRFLRARYPRLPVVCTGAMLSRDDAIELLRLGVGDVLTKPFTPTELRAAVLGALDRDLPSHLASLDFAAAIDAVREAIANGNPRDAARPLARAYAASPLDPDVFAYEGLRAELAGDDDAAVRGYRASLALQRDDSSDAPSAHDGLARIALYADARPVASLRGEFLRKAILVSAPTAVMPMNVEPAVIVFALALTGTAPPAVYLPE